jgi:hypothetical protein
VSELLGIARFKFHEGKVGEPSPELKANLAASAVGLFKHYKSM